MRKGSYYFVFLLLVAVQMLICNYLNLSPYLTLSIPPVLIMCVQLRIPTFWTLLLSFVTGGAVDLLSGGSSGSTPSPSSRSPSCGRKSSA